MNYILVLRHWDFDFQVIEDEYDIFCNPKIINKIRKYTEPGKALYNYIMNIEQLKLGGWQCIGIVR